MDKEIGVAEAAAILLNRAEAARLKFHTQLVNNEVSIAMKDIKMAAKQVRDRSIWLRQHLHDFDPQKTEVHFRPRKTKKSRLSQLEPLNEDDLQQKTFITWLGYDNGASNTELLENGIVSDRTGPGGISDTTVMNTHKNCGKHEASRKYKHSNFRSKDKVTKNAEPSSLTSSVVREQRTTKFKNTAGINDDKDIDDQRKRIEHFIKEQKEMNLSHPLKLSLKSKTFTEILDSELLLQLKTHPLTRKNVGKKKPRKTDLTDYAMQALGLPTSGIERKV